MNPAKLKVVELRAELSARGLDSKGVKAVLVERLQEALDKEEGNEGGDRSRNEEGDSSEEQTDAQGPTEPSEQEHGSESETEPSQKTPSKVDPSPPEESPKQEIDEAPAKKEPVEDEAAPEKTVSTPQKSREPTPQKTPPKAATPQKTSPQKPSVEEDAEMDVDEKPKGGDAAESKDDALDEKMDDAEEESDVKEEPDDSEYSKHQNEENGVKEGYEQDVKSEVKTEDDIKTESDIKSEPSETRESRKRRRSSSPSSPRSRNQGKTYDREPDINDNDVTLSWYDSDLNLTIDDKTFMSATPMSDGGFGYVWAGVRGTHGYTSGSLCYQVKATNYLDIAHLEDEPNPNLLRVGWSAFCTSLQLGEEPFSYGYGGTGKFSVDCKFSNYGKAFTLNDVITCYLEFTNDEVVMSFGLNDEYLGVAQRIPLESLKGKALAPHILTKNSSFSVNFGQEEVPWSQVQENYVFLNKYPIEEAVPGPRRPEKRSDCEMVMMCGLPGCGKTVWVTKYAAEHPEKNYTILGTNFLIDKMKVMGLPRKANYHGRWDVLIEKCTKCLQRLMDIGSHRRRNYILDQTNVYPAAQRRKMRNFEGFTRKAVVIVPTDEEFKSRVEKQAKEEKKDVPEIAVLEMKANFTLPDKNLFDEVNYIELQEEEAQALIQKYAKEAADKGVYPKSGPPGPHSKRFRGGDYHHPKNDFRRDRFSSGPPSSPFRRGSDRGGPRGGGGGRGGRGGGGPMDRWRDNRNQGGYGRPPQGDRQGWRGPPSGPPGGNGRGPRDFDRGPPRGGYDRNSRSGPPQRPGSGYNNRDHSRDHQRGPPGGPKPGMGGKPRPGDVGKHVAGGGPQSAPPAQWNNQYQNQGQQAATPNQAWGQQAQWNNANAQAWNNYQQQWKGYQQGYNQQGYSQGYNPQQYNNWQQYYGQYNAQGGWGQNSDGTYNYPQSWQGWYAPQNAGQTNTTQPPPTAK